MALLTAIRAATRQSTGGELAGHRPANSHALIGTNMIPEKSQLERWPEWMDLKTVQLYADVSDRLLREWIHLPVNPLPASQARGGKILIKRCHLDSWLEGHRYQSLNSIDVDQIADDILDQLGKAA